jgi:hypothetical protein
LNIGLLSDEELLPHLSTPKGEEELFLMWDLLIKLLEKIPAKMAAIFVSVGITSVFIWFLAFTAAALFGNRSVEFWPPKLGADTSLTAEIRSLTEELRKTIQAEAGLRVALMRQIGRAREQAAAFKEKGEDRAAEAYWKNAFDLVLELKRSDERLAERLSVMEQRLASLQRRL